MIRRLAEVVRMLGDLLEPNSRHLFTGVPASEYRLACTAYV